MFSKIFRHHGRRVVGPFLVTDAAPSTGGTPQRGLGTSQPARDSVLSAVEVGGIVDNGRRWLGDAELIDSTERALAAAEAEIRDVNNSPFAAGNCLHAEAVQAVRQGRVWLDSLRKLRAVVQSGKTKGDGDWLDRSNAATRDAIATINRANSEMWGGRETPTADTAPPRTTAEQCAAINEENRRFWAEHSRSTRGAPTITEIDSREHVHEPV